MTAETPTGSGSLPETAATPTPHPVRPHMVGSAYVCGICQQPHVAGCSQGTVRTTGSIHTCPNFARAIAAPASSAGATPQSKASRDIDLYGFVRCTRCDGSGEEPAASRPGEPTASERAELAVRKARRLLADVFESSAPVVEAFEEAVHALRRATPVPASAPSEGRPVITTDALQRWCDDQFELAAAWQRIEKAVDCPEGAPGNVAETVERLRAFQQAVDELGNLKGVPTEQIMASIYVLNAAYKLGHDMRIAVDRQRSELLALVAEGGR